METIEAFLKNINVFIVDDSEYTALTLKRSLINVYCNVLGFATTADEALKKIEELKNEIHIVTLDMFLGQIDGLTLIPKILQINPALKVIMISSNHDERLIIKSIQMGAKHYIIKPFNIVDIKNVVFKVARMP